MVDARCEVSNKCSDVGFGEGRLALVSDTLMIELTITTEVTLCGRLVGRSMYKRGICDRCATNASCTSQSHRIEVLHPKACGEILSGEITVARAANRVSHYTTALSQPSKNLEGKHDKHHWREMQNMSDQYEHIVH